MLLETPRLLLRRFTPSDAPFIVTLLNSEGWLRYIGDRGVHTVADAEGYIQRAALASYEKHGFGLYHVARKSDGTPVGMCGLLKRDYLDDVDIGYALLPEFAGQGYAFEACQRVVEHARDDFGCTRLAAVVQVDNTASIRVLAKLGQSRVGTVTLPSGDVLDLYRGDIPALRR